MEDLQQMTKDIVATCLPAALISDEDRGWIAKYRDLLLGIEDDLVQMFYDTLYAHEPTAAVFHDGERPAREASLREWWRETVTGDLGEKYLEWMALVGIIHIRRGVKNPMMLTMFQIVRDMISKNVFPQMPPEDVIKLGVAFSHVQVTAGSVIAEAYTKGYVGALESLAGLRPELTRRMLDIEVKQMERAGRESLA